MAELDPVVVELIAKVAKYNAEMQQTARRVGASLDLQEQSIVRLEGRMDGGFRRIGASANSSEKLISKAMFGIKGAIAGVSVIALARSFLSLADEAKGLDATLKLATQGFGSFGQAQKDVARIADETRTGLAETGKLYANFVRGAKELGASQADASRATETFAKTLQISGASSAEAASATLQFGQALAAGALRGDELNSILEASPRLARLLADGMGRPIGEIKKLGEAGELTSDKLLRALTDKKFTDGIDAEFKQMPVTFDQAMTKVSNSAIATFGAFDRGGEFSTALANFITGGSDGFADFAKSAEQAGIEVRATLAGLSGAFDPMRDAFGDLFEYMTGGAESWGEVFRGEIRNTLQEIDFLSARLAKIPNYWNSFADSWDALVNSVHGTNRPMRGQAKGTSLAADSDKRSAAERARLQNAAKERERQASVTAKAGATSNIKAPTSADTKKTKTPKAPKAPKSPLNPEAFAREEASLNDEILSLKAAELQNASDRTAIELQRIEAAKTSALTEIAGDKRYTDDQKKKVSALTETVAALQTASVVALREQQAAKDALDVRLNGLRDQEDLVRAQSDIANTRGERRDLELRLLDLAMEQERAELEAIIASKQATDVQRQIAQARLAVLGQIQSANAETIDRQYEGPLARRSREIGNIDIDDEKQQIAIDAMDRFADSTANAAAEYLKLGGIAGDVINGIIQDLIRLAVQQTIVKPLMNAVGGFFGISGARATGGPVSAGKTYLVGEKGPELFTAPSNGNIVPNHMLDTSAARSMVGASASAGGGRANVTQVLKFDLKGAVLTHELLAQMNQMAQSAAVGGAMAGANLAQSNIARKGRQRLP